MRLSIIIFLFSLLILSCQADPDILVIKNQSKETIQLTLIFKLPLKNLDTFSEETLNYISADKDSNVKLIDGNVIIELGPSDTCKLSFPMSVNWKKLHLHNDHSNWLDEINIISDKHKIVDSGYYSIFSIFKLKANFMQTDEYELIIQ